MKENISFLEKNTVKGIIILKRDTVYVGRFNLKNFLGYIKVANKMQYIYFFLLKSYF